MKPGGVGYKSDIDPINDLTNSTIDNAVIMHAVKVNYTLNDSLYEKPHCDGAPWRSQERCGFWLKSVPSGEL